MPSSTTPEQSAPAAPAGILAGLRVIDLATGLAGSAAALTLSEAGADVVKVMRADSRTDADPLSHEALFHVLDRGKQRIEVDLREVAQRATLDRLLDGADVLIHDLTPSEALALDLDDTHLLSRYPALVVSAIGAWPQRHALADAPVRETLVLARLGILDEQPGHRPGLVFIRMPFASWIASWLSAVAILARLIARQRGGVDTGRAGGGRGEGCGRGRGGVAHTSLAQAALVPMTMHWSRAAQPSASFAKGLDKNTPIPLHQASDGKWIHVHYSPDAAPWMAEGLAALGPAEVSRLNALHPPSHVAPNFGANKQIIATRPAQDWAEHFWAHDVAAQVAAPFGVIYSDEQARANGYVVVVDDPVLGATLQPGPAYAVDPPARLRGPWRECIDPLTVAWQDRVEASGSQSLETRPHVDSGAFGTPKEGAEDRINGMHPTRAAPLQGLKVLDLGAYLAGPFACMLLADLGADVIKVEPPAGDAMRRLERIFAGTQRGKRGLALKLGTPAAAPVLDALVHWADAVHHNMRLPAARKLGIAPEQLRARKPELLCAHVSSYGPLGARADWPGFDQLMQAACGWEVACGGTGQAPMWLRFGVGDHLAALASVFALLLGLFQRERTGQGQAVAASLLGAMLMTVGEVVARPDGSLTRMAALDAEQLGVSASHRLYRCSDGWIAVAAQGATETGAFHAVAGPDPASHFGTLSVTAALASLVGAVVPCEAVLQNQAAAFLDSTTHAAAGLHAHYLHAQYGGLQQIGGLWDFGDLPLAIDRPPPALGEHSAEVLRELGFTPAQIDALVQAGVTQQWKKAA